MRMFLFISATIIFLLGCAQAPSKEESRTPLTKRQRDSTLAETKIPGAKTVGKAIEVADSANARTERVDEQ